tara:strand:- start:204 stop:1142 length:939 start_codon:yes stop_codon:yes gene_type:complete
MSDYSAFKKHINDFERKLKPECEDIFLVHSSFKDIRELVDDLITTRDKKIQELETKLKKFDKSSTESSKPKKDCPPDKILNPKTGRCINKPKEKTHKKRGRPKKSMPQQEEFVKAWLKAKNGPTGTLLKLTNNIKDKFNATHQYGDDGEIIFKKYGVELGKPETDKIQKYVIDSQKNNDKPKKECQPGKIINPKTGRCIKKPKEKTHKKTGLPKKIVKASPALKKPTPAPEESVSSENFDEALEHIRTNGKPGSYKTFLNGIKRKFGITLKYDNHGDDYAVPDLYFMKGKKEATREEMEKVMKYVIDAAKKV